METVESASTVNQNGSLHLERLPDRLVLELAVMESRMKLGTFSHSGVPIVAMIDAAEERAFNLLAAARKDGAEPAFLRDMLGLIKAGPDALREVVRLAERHSGDRSLWLALGELEFLSPVPVPEQIRDASMFPQHIRNAAPGMRRIRAARAGRTLPEEEAGSLADVPEAFRRQPVFYFQNRHNVVGHGATVIWPAASEVMDFELEFGVFIGRDGRNIPRERARDHVFGYAIYNDFSARDVQADEMEAGFGPAKGKSFDGANVIGPWIVTSDDIPDPAALEASVCVNGELWGRSDSSAMLHDLDSIIAYLSRDEMLTAGEFIGLGTMGQGCGLELGRYLQHGDVVELYVERIGRLRNRVLRGGA